MSARGVDQVIDPVLGAAEQSHAESVRSELTTAIARCGGWISFEQFMDLALYAPGLGYYSAGSQKIGRGGDFTTAPEISVLFGVCVAQQCAEVLETLDNPSILEIGAGTGRLAIDLLTGLERLGGLPQHYMILELSADLRERQRESLLRGVPHLLERVVWLDTLPKQTFDGVVLANEVLDALPVTRFRWSAGACEELGVGVVDGNFGWLSRAASESVATTCRALADAAGGWNDGYISEYCPRLKSWTHDVTAALHRGAVLWFDYGLPRREYYLAERHEGTLICHYRQRAHDNPFALPGLQDISAWVDFTALAEAGAAAGFEVAGFTTQAFFLAGLGVDREMRRVAGDDAMQFARLASQARQLMLPGEMGERFKAMVWIRGVGAELSGFALQDLRNRL